MGKYSKQWEELKPIRPKKPASFFASFVANYYATQATPKQNGPNLFRDAATSWANLGKGERDNFMDRNLVEQYKERMKEYKSLHTAMKKPPESFALYVRNYFRINKPKVSRLTFGPIIKQIALDWKELSEEEQNIFKKGSSLLKALFEEEQRAVISGERDFNLAWQNQGMDQVYHMLLTNKIVDGGSVEELLKPKQKEENSREEADVNDVEMENDDDDYDEAFDNFD